MKLSLSKTSWILLTIGVFVVLFASLGMTYSEQSEQQSQLDQQLEVAQQVLDKYSSEQFSLQLEDLENRLTETESQLAVAKDALSPSIETIEISDVLFEIAQTCNVEIVEITSQLPSTEELNGTIYYALPIMVKIKGDLPDLLSFISKWTDKYNTGLIELVKINVPQEQELGELEEPSAEIKLVIYKYQGEQNG